ncbi:MAG: NAD(P)-dependent oxidoreductase [Ignavibacteria bacterium]|jgi:dTDP-4-dehydrorhamnose reductase|nr:NAD(P)-dependent oxidoreductase [Ignavibacteria bacterium]MCU7502678.1 NAD(P)-dependent oxidoreductase [Ignavibacteria bacterium]MCU7515119.1 NAD(P)-dependent oxidoreductase [Ignavibacteria bacterium]
MKNALIGYSGYVGSSLLRQHVFENLYRSSNIGEITSKAFDLVVCAAAPAKKWIANKEPGEDLKNIENLISHLATIDCGKFILISTVDVFNDPHGVSEKTGVKEEGLHPYGLHRRMLEKFVEEHFKDYLIIRLPGLVGPGLRKNVIFDFRNGNNLHAIDSRGLFQFYPMVNLWADIKLAIESKLKLLHLTAEPLGVSEIAEACFGMSFHQLAAGTPARYDFRSDYAGLFGGKGFYQYSKRESILAIRAYAQSEPLALRREGDLK